MEGNRQFFPTQSCSRRIRFHFLEGVSERFAEIPGLRLGGHSQRIFLLVIAEAAPRSRVLRKNNRPLILIRDGVQPISSPPNRFPFPRNITPTTDSLIPLR